MNKEDPMGAQTFHQQAWNPDLQEAYNSAFGEAQYDHGHSGYTGSLAEKLSFVVIDEVQPLPAADAWDYADELDTSFGTGGIKSFDLVADHAEAFNAVAVAGNSMVVAGSSGSDLIVARLAELYSPAPTTTTTTAPPTTTTTSVVVAPPAVSSPATTTTIQFEGPRPSVPATPVPGEPSFTG
jgi:hypothetical protein